MLTRSIEELDDVGIIKVDVWENRSMAMAADVELPSAGVSKAVFGNSYMLGLMRAIAQQEQDAFTTTELLTSLDIAVNLIHPLLARLERARMIERAGRVPGERTLLFRRLPSPLWQAALLLDGGTGETI